MKSSLSPIQRRIETVLSYYRASILDFPFFALITMTVYIIYRLKIWGLFRSIYTNYGGLSYGDYFLIYGFSDSAIILLSMGLTLAILIATARFLKLRYILLSFLILIQTFMLMGGIEFFRIYETTL